MSNFTSILSKPMSEIEKPKPLPIGSYLCIVDGVPELTQIGQKQTDAAVFKLKVLQPLEDVDTEQLAEAGGVSNKTLRLTLFLTEDSLHRAKKLLNEHMGIEEDKTLQEALMEAQGRQVVANVSHRPSQDGTELYAEVKSTAKP
jgi:hypothetical protein